MSKELIALKSDILDLYESYRVEVDERDQYSNFIELYALACIVNEFSQDKIISDAYDTYISLDEPLATNYTAFLDIVVKKDAKYADAFSCPTIDASSNLLQVNIKNLVKLKQLLQSEQMLYGEGFSYLIQYIGEIHGSRKAGVFTTPSAIHSLLIELVPPKEDMAVYDPVCGTGGFLAAAANAVNNKDCLSLVGMDIAQSAVNIARQNLLINGFKKSTIEQGNSLTQEPKAIGAKYDFVFANPPFSLKDWSDGIDVANDERFVFGSPPTSKGDYAFILHCLHALNDKGRAAIIVSSGPLVRSASEGQIRSNLIENNFVEGVIALPPNIFHGTSIAANILILNKNKINKSINFVNGASFFEANRALNKLSSHNLDKIVELYNQPTDIPEYKAYISNEKVLLNHGTLLPTQYIEKEFVSAITGKLEELKSKQNDLSETLISLQKQMRNLTDD